METFRGPFSASFCASCRLYYNFVLSSQKFDHLATVPLNELVQLKIADGLADVSN
jgi:hypothetical protein